MTQSLYASAWNSPFGDYISLDHHHHHHHHYPPPPPTTVLDVSRPCSSSSSSSHTLVNKQPRFEAASWDSVNDVYSFSPIQHDAAPSPEASPESDLQPPPPTTAQVKREESPEDFVFEVPASIDAATVAYPAFSSMTEVPLRATQATTEMRRMMGVFRLDPFTMHNAIRDSSANLNWNGEPIGPLREEPSHVEFQLDFYGDQIKSEPPPALRHIVDERSQPSRKSLRHRTSPNARFSEPSPTPSLDYATLHSPSSSPHDTGSHAWPDVSADSQSLVYSPALLHSQQPFDTVLTPAQGMEASLAIDFNSRYMASSRESCCHL